ncbi:MAG: hypothetical protein R2762_30195 [Bryobacteraceae bacterium]
MPPERTEQQLERLGAIAREPMTPEAVEIIRGALSDRSSAVVAKAARIAGGEGLRELGPDLAKAFDRLMDGNAVQKDKGCGGKTAIAEALRAVEYYAGGVFERGIRHVQMEPVFGGQADMAAELRASCALGLVDERHPDAALLAVDLLADPEMRARIGAVKALGATGRRDALLALRLKALLGDAEQEVTAECFVELLEMDRRGSFDFVARVLGDADPVRVEAAALALAATREQRAFEMISARLQSALDPELKKALLLAIGAMRTDESVAYLIQTVSTGSITSAAGALEALALAGLGGAVRERAGRAVAARGDSRVTAMWARMGFSG